MKEQEYVNATDLRAVQLARVALLTIVPANSKVITAEDMQVVINLLCGWEAGLFNEMDIDPNNPSQDYLRAKELFEKAKGVE